MTTGHVPDLDAVDYAVLHTLHDSEESLWKNRIHERLHETQESLPITSPVSVQTVGRRVDTLHDRAYIASEIDNPNNLKRDLIIAYTVTDQGEVALRNIREQLLKKYVTQSGHDEQDKAVILHLLTETEDIAPEMEQFLETECTTEEVIVFTELYYMKRFVRAHLSPEKIREFLLLTHGEPGGLLFQDTPPETGREPV